MQELISVLSKKEIEFLKSKRWVEFSDTLDLEDVLIGVMTQKMNINKKQKIVVESEFMDKQSLQNYLKNKKVNYYDFKKAHKTLVNKGILDE